MTVNEGTQRLLNHIGNELKLLWLQMDTYQELFLVEQERRRALLQATAPGFFTMIQAPLAESILMRVFRLMDPKESFGKGNASLDRFGNELPADMAVLKDMIDHLSKEWKNGSFSALKTIRDKMLSHNDLDVRDGMEPDQLWFNISLGDFDLVRRLAGGLWNLYRQCNRSLLGTDVVEPIHASLYDRPAMLLKHLCASRYLDSLMDGNPEHLAKLRAIEDREMGEDRNRPVFPTTDVMTSRNAVGHGTAL